MRTVHGLHHVTAISGPAQENLDFYAGVLGMRLVKKSVNQDDPGTYHLFYADAEGHPGTDITFFPWAQMVEPAVRFGEQVLPMRDPHGLGVALVESKSSLDRAFTPWEEGPIPVERQIRGLETARMSEASLGLSAAFLTEAMGFREVGTENGWHRYGVGEGKSGQYVDVRELADARRGAWGTGSIDHLAWRVEDEAHQAEVRASVAAGGAQPTPVIDRFWFKSVYFKEPGGALFELATDGPGFAVDEDAAHLGETLVLPP